MSGAFPQLPLHDLCCDRHPPEDAALAQVARGGRVQLWSFGEVAEESRRFAEGLHRRGVRRGDRVAVVMGQRVEAPLLHLTASRLGAISVPLSPLFGPDGLRPRLEDARPRLVLTTQEERAKVEAATDAEVLVAEDVPFGDLPPLEPGNERTPGPEAPMMLVYTSGTTGRPKGVLLPHRVVPGRLPGLVASHPGMGSGEDRFWSPADWSWIGGLLDSLFAPWALGVSVLGHDRGPGGFSWARTLPLLEEQGVTRAFLPPTALRSLQKSCLPAPRLRSVHAAGEPLTESVQAWAEKAWGFRVADVYGLSEAAFLVGQAGHEPPPDPESLGRPFPGQVVAVLTGEGALTDDYDVGEIGVHRATPTLMLGYWRGPGEMPELPLADGMWFRTGDLAYRDEAGNLHYEGRRDDVIKTRGYRVSPGEVEAALLLHPAVEEAAVVGDPDPEWGQAIHAHVRLAPGESPSETLAEALRARVRERLAAHDVPKHVTFVDELPKTTSGKVQRRALREG